MAENLLENGDFEGKVWRKTHSGQEYANMECPEHFTMWWYEDVDNKLYKPECHVIEKVPPFTDPPRVLYGHKAWQMFKSFGKVHGGLYQAVTGLKPGYHYQIRLWGHAWSLHDDVGPCSNSTDPTCSSGVGKGPHWIAEADLPALNGNAQNDAISNAMFRVGVSEGTEPDPFSILVTWATGAAIYNEFAQLQPFEFVAPDSGNAVVYLSFATMWNFRQGDGYFDQFILEEVAEPVSDQRGKPRVDYERTYVLINSNRSKEWPIAAIEGTWGKTYETVGQGGDDAGIGDLSVRNVKAVNPGDWSPTGDPRALEAFYAEHYKGVNYEPIEAATPEILRRILSGEVDPTKPPPQSLSKPGHPVGLHLQTLVPGWDDYVRDTQPGIVKLVGNYEAAVTVKALSQGNTETAVRFHLGHQNPYLYAKDKRAAARDFGANFWPALHPIADSVDYALELNEYIGTNTYDARMHGVEWMIAYCEELYAEFGGAIRPGLGSFPVGNPQHGKETEDLIPAARACQQYDGLWFYHGYWMPGRFAASDENYPLHYHFRALLSHDPVFVANGIYVKHALGEGGVVGVKSDGVTLEAQAGWRDTLGYSGNWGLFKPDLLELTAFANQWNAANGNRFRGGAMFTSGIGVGWWAFQMTQDEWNDLPELRV